MIDQEFFMNLALQNANAQKGQTDPNPLVGAVIVNEGRIVGIGAHLKAGEPHAEIHALSMAGEYANGGTIYVTLEPCSHHGRTGPCAEAIVRAGIKNVVIATLDPNPLVSGNGVKILEEAGINVQIGVCGKESRKMNEVFNKFIVSKRPFVTMKAGASLDGKIATRTMDSKWITSEGSRKDVHLLRNQHMAILVGINTVISDNPELTARIPNGRNPIRVILDSKLRMPLDSKVVTDGLAKTWIFTSGSAAREKEELLKSMGVEVFRTSGEKQVNVEDVLDILGEKLVSSLLLEGGGTVHASFLEKGLVDKVILYFAPKLIGGEGAPTFLEGTGSETMRDVVTLADTDIVKIGDDFRFTGYPTENTKNS